MSFCAQDVPVSCQCMQYTLVFCTNKRNCRCVYLLKCCPPNGSHSFSVDHSEMYSFEFSLTLACLEVSALTKIKRLCVQRLWSVNLATHRLSSSSHRLPIEKTDILLQSKYKYSKVFVSNFRITNAKIAQFSVVD